MIPTPQQLAWQEAGFGLFFHIGPNTFHGLEWGDGTSGPATFDPGDLKPVTASELTIRLDAPGELAAVTVFAV